MNKIKAEIIEKFDASGHARSSRNAISIEKGKFPCGVCEESFKHKTHLNRHKLTHKERSIPCDHCTKLFADGKLLKIHRPKIGKTLQCKYCSKIFNRQNNLEQRGPKHTSNYCHLCTRCGDKFMQKE